MIAVSQSVTIRRPLDEVQAQFGDVGYHQQRGHHRGVTFRVVEDNTDWCEYGQETRVGPLRLRQRFLLRRADGAHQVNELVEGALAPGSITFDIVANGDDAAEVTATVRSERGGLTRVTAPLLRRILARALAQSLEEDRVDLESGSYARR
jgi:hypothetical protein